MALKKFYLRLEAVNLDNFVYDTNNLSVIRGGGLMLLELPEHARQKLKEYQSNHDDQINKITTISKGASWGLFSIELKDEKQDCVPEEVAGFLKKNIQKDKPEPINEKEIEVFRPEGERKTEKWPPPDKQKILYAPKHATVMVEAYGSQEKEETFQEIREKLLAKLRWRQMQSPSIAFPTVVTGPVEVKKEDGTTESRYVCELDLVRPAAEQSEYKIKGQKRAVSSSSYARYKYGAWGKSDQWYEKITGLNNLPLFTHDFHEIANNIGQNQKELSLLEGKMAVIYLDGNNFGKLQQEKCKTPDKQRQFDKKLREQYQNGTLKHLLDIIRNDEDWINPKCQFLGSKNKDETTPKIRLETLLWGGDELIWVAPAWRGWWLLGKYFQLVEGKLDGEHWEFEGVPLTFGAGIVFCHNTAPIYRIKNIAWQLAEEAKSVSREKNLAAVQVLESYDLAGTDFERFRKERRPLGVPVQDLLIKGGNMLEIAELFTTIKKELPRRQLYRLIKALLRGEKNKTQYNTLIKGLSESAQNNLECLESCFPSEKAMWFHLLELWDYLIVPSSPQGGQTP